MACRQACHRLTATTMLASSSLSSSSVAAAAARRCKIIIAQREGATAFVIRVQKVCFSATVDPKKKVDTTRGNPDQPETATSTEAPPTLSSLISKRKTAPSSSVDDDGNAKPMNICSASLGLRRKESSKCKSMHRLRAVYKLHVPAGTNLVPFRV